MDIQEKYCAFAEKKIAQMSFDDFSEAIIACPACHGACAECHLAVSGLEREKLWKYGSK